jgi:hypothetical protein
MTDVLDTVTATATAIDAATDAGPLVSYVLQAFLVLDFGMWWRHWQSETFMDCCGGGGGGGGCGCVQVCCVCVQCGGFALIALTCCWFESIC